MQVVTLAWNFGKAHSISLVASVTGGISCNPKVHRNQCPVYRSPAIFLFLLALSPFWLANVSEAFGCQEKQLPTATHSGALETTESEQTRDWIQKLGDSDFHVRELANANLSKIGHDAMTALIQAKANSSYEQRLRIDRLIAKIVASSRVDELSSFLDGQLNLPGWSTFSNIVGDTEPNRHLFMDLYRQKMPLVKQIARNEVEPRVMANEVARAINATTDSDSLSTIACFSLYVAANLESLDKKETASQHLPLAQMTYSNYGPKFLLHGPYCEFHQAVLDKWISIDSKNRHQQNQQLNVAIRLNREAGLPVARKILLGKNEYSSTTIIDAFEMVARFGTSNDIPSLSKQLKNARLSHQGVHIDSSNKRHSLKISIGDVALASSIRLAGEQPEEYGFVETHNVHRPNYLIPSKLHGFLSEEDREAAVQKWIKRKPEILRSNPTKPKPAPGSLRLPLPNQHSNPTSPNSAMPIQDEPKAKGHLN